VLVGMGLTNFSMNSASIPVVKKMIRDLDTTKAKNSVKKIMTLNRVQEILELILTEYKEMLPFTETDENI
jgi:phosphotransferase system enzyme I (PtsI)